MKAKIRKNASDDFADKLATVHRKSTRVSTSEAKHESLQNPHWEREIIESLDKLLRKGRFRTISW